VLLKELEEQFGLSHGTIWDIVHERLGYRKVCSRWIPRQLTEDNKKTRMGASLTHLLRFNYIDIQPKTSIDESLLWLFCGC